MARYIASLPLGIVGFVSLAVSYYNFYELGCISLEEAEHGSLPAAMLLLAVSYVCLLFAAALCCS